MKEISRKFVEKFKDSFEKSAERYHDTEELTEMTDCDIESIVEKYFSFCRLTEANDYFESAIDAFVPDTWNKIDRSLNGKDVMETPEYRQWERHSHVSYAMYDSFVECCLEEEFCRINGKVRTDEEAAKLAAGKWCELLFGWHLQDNGALDESHQGGFAACALGTVLAEKSRERITEEMKQKAHDLLYEYYLYSIGVQNNRDVSAVVWARENLKDPDKDKAYKWDLYSFGKGMMYCDYSPYMPLYLVL